MSNTQVLQCQSCGEWRHISYFRDGGRACLRCQSEGKVYVPFQIAEEQRKAARQDKHLNRAAIKTIIQEWIEQDTLPEDITADERKIIRLRTLDELDIFTIARFMKISEKRALAIESRAQLKLARLAADQIPERFGATPPEEHTA